MPQKINVLTTEADLLIDLLRNAREISLADAAKELNVPLKTIEAWANFLEEEKKLSINYKFTTPFLVYRDESGKKEKLHKPFRPVFIPKKPDQGGDAAEKSLEKFRGEIEKKFREEDVSKDPSILFDAIDRAMKLANSFTGLSGRGKEALDAQLNALAEHAKRLRGAAKQNKEISSDDVKKVNSQIRNVYSLLKKSSKGSMRHENLEANALVEKAYELLKQGNVEEAKAAYDELRETYNEMPKAFAEKRSGVERDMMKLHSELTESMEKESAKSLKKAYASIMKMLGDAKAAMGKGDFKKMEELYGLMKEVFERLPAGFANEKRGLERELVRFYEDALKNKEKYFLKDIGTKSKMIRERLRKISDSMRKNDMEAAVNAYAEVRSIFAGLPAGFMKEKAALQHEILPVYEQLLVVYKDEVYELTTRKTGEIKQLLAVMHQHLASNSIGLAETAYRQMQQIYDSLPNGFLTEKTEIQEEMLKSYEELISKSEIMASQQMYAKITELRNLLREAKKYLESKEYEMAEEIYLELINAYNDLPLGFMPEKTRLRSEILDLYKELTMKVDHVFLQKTPSDTSKKYSEIIHTLIDVHRAVEQHRFDSIAPLYNHAKIIFNELPLGFVHKNLRLRNEIMKTYKELQLYKKTLQLEDSARKNDDKKTKALLREVMAMKNELAAECPEDRELFNFVNRKYDYYIKETGKKQGLQLPGRKQKPAIREIMPVQKPTTEPFITETPAPFVEKIIKTSMKPLFAEANDSQKDMLTKLKEREDDIIEIKRKIDVLKESMKPRVRAL